MDGDNGDGPKWWQVWDEIPSEAARKRKREVDASPAQDKILEQCRSMSNLELQEKVASLQKSLLRPLPDTLEAELDRGQRQALLRDARHLLAERLKPAASHEPSSASPASGLEGGFL